MALVDFSEFHILTANVFHALVHSGRLDLELPFVDILRHM